MSKTLLSLAVVLVLLGHSVAFGQATSPPAEPSAYPVVEAPVPLPLPVPQTEERAVPEQVTEERVRAQLHAVELQVLAQQDVQGRRVRSEQVLETSRLLQQTEAVNARLSATTLVARTPDGLYQQGLRQLQQRQFDEAVTSFQKVIEQKHARADAALYWKAFAEYKAGRREAALASIAQLRRDHASSRYLGDARVLEADLSGGRALTAADDDDEIKLLAIQGLSKTSDAVPLLERVLTSTNSLGVKRRALYVLALSSDAKAGDILLRYAKGAGNPDLQVEAIRYLGERRTPAAGDQLREIYLATSDTNVKMAVIDAFRVTRDSASIMRLLGDGNVVTTERQQIFGRLIGLVKDAEVLALYKGETDAPMRATLVRTLGSVLSTEQLAQIAQSDADGGVRQAAVGLLAGRRDEGAAKALVTAYHAQSDPRTRRAIVTLLGLNASADVLVTLAKQETDAELKRDLVRRLSTMAPNSKAAADYLMEQLR